MSFTEIKDLKSKITVDESIKEIHLDKLIVNSTNMGKN